MYYLPNMNEFKNEKFVACFYVKESQKKPGSPQLRLFTVY